MVLTTRGRLELAALISIALPLAGAQLSQLAMSLIGSMALGRLDSTAFAAGGLCGVIIQTVTVISQGIVAGAQPLLASDRGAKAAGLSHAGMAAKAFAGAYIWAALLSVLAMLALANLGTLLSLFAFEPEVIASVGRYMATGIWSLPAILLLAPLRFHLAVEQRTWMILVASACGIPVYAGLVIWLVFGAPDMGIAGAGLAFALTWWLIAAIVALYALVRRLLPEDIGNLRPGEIGQGAIAVFRIGLPIALIYAAEMGLLAVVLLLMGGFGTVALAAHQVSHSLNAIAFMPALALGQAATVRVAFHMGGGRPADARFAGNLAIGFACALMLAFCVTILVFSDQLTLIFIGPDNADIGAITALVRLLNMVLVGYLLFDGLQAASNGALRGLKDTRIPMFIGVVSYWLLGFPVAWLAGYAFALGPVGIALGVLAGIGAAGCLLFMRWLRAIRATPATAGIVSAIPLANTV